MDQFFGRPKPAFLAGDGHTSIDVSAHISIRMFIGENFHILRPKMKSPLIRITHHRMLAEFPADCWAIIGAYAGFMTIWECCGDPTLQPTLDKLSHMWREITPTGINLATLPQIRAQPDVDRLRTLYGDDSEMVDLAQGRLVITLAASGVWSRIPTTSDEFSELVPHMKNPSAPRLELMAALDRIPTNSILRIYKAAFIHWDEEILRVTAARMKKSNHFLVWSGVHSTPERVLLMLNLAPQAAHLVFGLPSLWTNTEWIPTLVAAISADKATHRADLCRAIPSYHPECAAAAMAAAAITMEDILGGPSPRLSSILELYPPRDDTGSRVQIAKFVMRAIDTYPYLRHLVSTIARMNGFAEKVMRSGVTMSDTGASLTLMAGKMIFNIIEDAARVLDESMLGWLREVVGADCLIEYCKHMPRDQILRLRKLVPLDECRIFCYGAYWGFTVCSALAENAPEELKDLMLEFPVAEIMFGDRSVCNKCGSYRGVSETSLKFWYHYKNREGARLLLSLSTKYPKMHTSVCRWLTSPEQSAHNLWDLCLDLAVCEEDIANCFRGVLTKACCSKYNIALETLSARIGVIASVRCLERIVEKSGQIAAAASVWAARVLPLSTWLRQHIYDVCARASAYRGTKPRAIHADGSAECVDITDELYCCLQYLRAEGNDTKSDQNRNDLASADDI